MAYRVELPVFCGPMDLLLHLVKQNEVDVHDVRIAAILEQYLRHLEVLEALDLADLGDFLVTASSLMEVKSRELLPREDVEVDEELDPRDDLIRRLLEYKRYRDVARRLDRFARRRKRMHDAFAPMPRDLDDGEDDLLDLGEVELWTLTAAFAKLLEETGQRDSRLEIDVDKRDIRYFAARVLEVVKHGGEVPFLELFDRSEGRFGLIGAFIAVLEMMKQGVLRAHMRDGRVGDIVVVFVGDPSLSVDQILASDDRLDESGEPPSGDASAARPAEPVRDRVEPSPAVGGRPAGEHGHAG